MRPTATVLLLVVALCAAAGCTEPGQTEIARGNVLASQKKFKEAIEAYKAAATAAPNKARPRELLGHVYFDQNDKAAARQAYADAIRVEPNAALEAQIGLARIDADDGKLDEAIEQLGKVLERQPGNVYALLSRANLEVRRAGPNDAEAAITDTAEAMRVDESNPAVLYTRGCAFLAAKNLELADQTFDKLAAAQPKKPLGYYGKARVAAARADRTGAIANLRLAKERTKESPESWNADEVKGDAAFRFIQDDPDFKQLFL